MPGVEHDWRSSVHGAGFWGNLYSYIANISLKLRFYRMLVEDGYMATVCRFGRCVGMGQV